MIITHSRILVLSGSVWTSSCQPKHSCKQQVADRNDHEVIRAGSGRRIVEEQFCQYEKVNVSEGDCEWLLNDGHAKLVSI